MAIQSHRFTPGGGVVHRIPWKGGTMSAWYSPKGDVVDVEASRNGRVFRTGKDARNEAARFAWMVKGDALPTH